MADDIFSPPRPGPASRSLYERSCAVMPGGVSSPVRSFASVGGTPYVVERGAGAYVVDVDGRRYVDYVQSYGASILGHAHPKVVEAVRRAAASGTSFGAPTPGEVELAERIVGAVPGLDELRFTSSGTEAVMTAVRLARGVTGRARVVKFAGCYHGHSDALLVAGGSGIATLGLPGSAGVTQAAVADTLVAPYNELPRLDGSVACVLVEPVAANMGLVEPEAGFLAGLRRACDDVGALLIFDEVITGFRLGPSGATGRFAVSPDLWCFGKVIGGGLPLAAVGGRRELMDALAPRGPVYQAGTLSGNPLATAAGLAVLDELGIGSSEATAVYDELTARVGELAGGLGQVLKSAGFDVVAPNAGPILGLAFARLPLRTYDDAVAAASNGHYVQFFRGMLAEGIAFAPSAFEVGFPSLAHGRAEIDATLVAAEKVAKAMAAAQR